ncbi:hypothetical protein QA639_12935 [Bradyrhizobium pachyrhizi]|nr:hypothetical protein [Bradyrhizobium pachyrhizi]WFU58342.1 hypothetical protein QA639_12935 [Bradyrhizobium pachyrhizi]
MWTIRRLALQGPMTEERRGDWILIIVVLSVVGAVLVVDFIF